MVKIFPNKHVGGQKKKKKKKGLHLAFYTGRGNNVPWGSTNIHKRTHKAGIITSLSPEPMTGRALSRLRRLDAVVFRGYDLNRVVSRHGLLVSVYGYIYQKPVRICMCVCVFFSQEYMPRLLNS